jgi:hypothetical protein
MKPIPKSMAGSRNKHRPNGANRNRAKSKAKKAEHAGETHAQRVHRIRTFAVEQRANNTSLNWEGYDGYE